MKVTNIELYSNEYEALNFAMENAAVDNQYYIRAMVGLDADEIIPKFYGFGLQSRPKYYDFGLKQRQIVMRIALNPRYEIAETYSNIRDTLYRAISSSRTGKLRLIFKSGPTSVAYLDGFITKFEVPHFSATPEVQITFNCEDPMFRALNPVTLDPEDISSTSPITIADSISTAPHGFSMQLTFTASSSTFTLQDAATNPEWKFKIQHPEGFSSGDVLYFSSEIGNKYLYIDRSNTIIPLMDAVDPTSLWPIIFPGANTFYILEMANFDWNKIEFYAAYWGV